MNITERLNSIIPKEKWEFTMPLADNGQPYCGVANKIEKIYSTPDQSEVGNGKILNIYAVVDSPHRNYYARYRGFLYYVISLNSGNTPYDRDTWILWKSRAAPPDKYYNKLFREEYAMFHSMHYEKREMGR